MPQLTMLTSTQTQSSNKQEKKKKQPGSGYYSKSSQIGRAVGTGTAEAENGGLGADICGLVW